MNVPAPTQLMRLILLVKLITRSHKVLAAKYIKAPEQTDNRHFNTKGTDPTLNASIEVEVSKSPITITNPRTDE